MEHEWRRRLERDLDSMTALDEVVAKELFKPKQLSREAKAATSIQRIFRGVLGRRIYVELLYDSYIKTHEEIRIKTEKQVAETPKLLSLHDLDVQLQEASYYRNLKRRHTRRPAPPA